MADRREQAERMAKLLPLCQSEEARIEYLQVHLEMAYYEGRRDAFDDMSGRIRRSMKDEINALTER